MNSTSIPGTKPVTLQQFIDLYNKGEITSEELAKQVSPILARHRSEAIFCTAIALVSDSPDRYHLSSPQHARLWKDAQAAHDANVHAAMAAKPSLLHKLQETVRRAQAALNKSRTQDQTSA
jgi:hypothetical protein